MKTENLILWVILIFVLAASFGTLGLEKWREISLSKSGLLTKAVIETVKDTGNRHNDDPIIDMTVSYLQAGQQRRSTLSFPISSLEIQNYKIGSYIFIRIDQDDPQIISRAEENSDGSNQ